MHRGLEQSKGIQVFHTGFCKVALVASSELVAITELALGGEGGAIANMLPHANTYILIRQLKRK